MDKTSAAVPIVVLSALLGLWIWNLAYTPTIAPDDAFVFMRYARNWAGHGTLDWNIGEPGTDGFTSLGYLAAVALTYAMLGGDVVSSAWYVSVIAATGTLIVSFLVPMAAGRESPRFALRAVVAATGVASATALSPYFAFWAHSMMDGSFAALAICLASIATAYLLTANRQTAGLSMLCSAAVALLAISRPEGFLVAVVLLLMVVVRGTLRAPVEFSPDDARSVRVLRLGAAALAVAMATYFAWHWLRFGHAFPNPVYVKTGGLSLVAIKHGLGQLLAGPARGALPGIPVVQDVISPTSAAWPYLLLLACLPALFVSSFVRAVWEDSRPVRWIRHLLLVPMGMLGVTVLSGGDVGFDGEAFFVGWRFLSPLLPMVPVAAALAVGALVRPVRLVILLLLLLTVAHGAWAVARKPGLCAATWLPCGVKAVQTWPVSRTSYVWNASSGWHDSQLVAQLEQIFPADIVIGQSDFLRVAALSRFRVLDLSGLVNAELAHASDEPSWNLFSVDDLMRYRPEVYIYGWRYITGEPLAGRPLDGDDMVYFLDPWPPPGSTEAVQELIRTYAGASVRLNNGGFFNFLVRKDVLAEVESRGSRPGD